MTSKTTTIIRTNAGKNTGIGHLVRCLQLAKALKKHQSKVIFVLDYIEQTIQPFLSHIETQALYLEPQEKLNEVEDAQKCLALLDQYQAANIVIDDYRLAKSWEETIYQNAKDNIQLLVIDDLLREHQCDILVDMKWRGLQTQTAYDALIPNKATKLLGPDYVLLDEKYQNQIQHNQLKPTPENEFTIMLGLGGAGDLLQCQQLIDFLLSQQTFDFDFKLLVVLGPLAHNSERFIEHYENNNKVELLVGKTDLYLYLENCHLYIGAAGGIIYQLLALKIPALTFAIAENQHSEKAQLAQLGHYFHLDSFSEITAENLTYFVNSAYTHYARIKSLILNAEQPIDALGTERVAKQLLALPALFEGSQSKSSQTEQNNCSSEHQYLIDSNSYTLRAVNDSDINHYLQSRNLPNNCQNMIQAEPIPFLSHYAWWFNTKRDSYLLSHQGKPVLYIWHEIRKIEDKAFLIGGWFICERDIGFQEALLALNWQLEHCKNLYPTTPWVAVIHKENKFVRLLNKYLGFSDIGTDHAYDKAIKTLFNGAERDNFHYVTYCPNSNTDEINR
ncbi:UDP-2,4-diacetamido-2,4,6-trideoxy-beta-L-altropyranose hydrolase [Litorilituus lipolyticus]|uniref:UDP-2,4-diacetamido-2,4, 6-trideoxy-beta-L-altropyranose hydrolase n=1 Tax=Litorilituus lipolyticus TaxID=2491017 RepID=A0A502L411_9GAMM|nr:UDP-2,4-diacetamido-2,4,6-trideoxy-beta-L-altropyranose hydrolase [Litorilituus lipolyticus]TPH17155.1 UDP-2,4-diacetamido-2,4,6-trideoxy-beta-L-altropyranose hydrolase [Litorilituus lipolyticus]